MTPPSPLRRHAAHKRAAPPGFDFTHHIRHVCDDMVSRLEELRHIRMRQVAISFAQTRRATDHGMYASLTPMRFAGGRPHVSRRGKQWSVQQLRGPDGREMLYILTFYLPRFLDRPLREKLSTVMHELWHIGPRFDGDTRRFGGRCHAHGSSQTRYDAQIDRLVHRWLALDPPEGVYGFLRANYRELVARHGRVFGHKIPTPRLLPIE